MESKQGQPIMEPTTEFEEDEIIPLSGNPYFCLIIERSNLSPFYQLVLPAKIQSVLPHATVPAVLTCRGRNWETLYHGDLPTKTFHSSWRTFATDNHLKGGDACVFELMECSKRNIKFKVQILKGDLPDELLAEVIGATSESPVVID